MTSPYNIDEHRKRFSLWAAYRAAQAGGGKGTGEELTGALRACGLLEFLANNQTRPVTKKRFDAQHAKWVAHICDTVWAGDPTTYGRAAKMVAVFIKSYFILGGHEQSALARVAHPPIDSKLLKKIGTIEGTDLAQFKWKQLNKTKYDDLIKLLRKHNGTDQPFWSIETDWPGPD